MKIVLWNSSGTEIIKEMKMKNPPKIIRIPVLKTFPESVEGGEYLDPVDYKIREFRFYLRGASNLFYREVEVPRAP